MPVHPSLLRFWQAHAQPGSVGLIGIRFLPVRIIEKGQAPLTTDGQNSRWVHAFIFQRERDGIPWIYESDVGIPRRGFIHWTPGAKEDPVTKWSGERITNACVLTANLNDEQVEAALRHARELISKGTRYRLRELIGTWLAIRGNRMERENVWHTRDALHCGGFVRACLLAADVEPIGPEVAMRNTAPELLYRHLQLVAEWTSPSN